VESGIVYSKRIGLLFMEQKMKKLYTLSFLLLTTFASSFAVITAAWAEDVQGVYNTKQEWRESGYTYSLSYRLDLKSDNSVDLVIERGGNDRFGRDSVYSHGEILNHLERSNKLTQHGTWRERRGSVTINLDTIDTGRYDERLSTTLSGRLDGRTLDIDRFDSRLYGRDTDLRFEKHKGSNTGTIVGIAALAAIIFALSQNKGSSTAGTYEYVAEWRARGEQYAIHYTLDLKKDKKANFIADIDNVPIDSETRQDWGNIIDQSSARQITQTGHWQQDKNNLSVNLTTQSAGDRERRINSTIQASISKKTIKFTSWDDNLYGSRPDFEFQKK